MTQRVRITVDVRPDGTMVAATHNVTGPRCLDEVNRIEALCGGTISSSRLTDDYEGTTIDSGADFHTVNVEEST